MDSAGVRRSSGAVEEECGRTTGGQEGGLGDIAIRVS